MYKIAVIGGPDTVVGFKALGLDTYPVTSAEEARHSFRHIETTCEDYAIIYIEENLSTALSAELERYKSRVKPALILIPGREGSSGLSLTALHEAVKRAVGADIL